MRTILAVALLGMICGVANAQASFGVTVSGGTGKFAPFQGQTLRATLLPGTPPGGGQKWFGMVSGPNGTTTLTVVMQNITGTPPHQPSQLISVYIMGSPLLAPASYATLPLSGGSAATLAGGIPDGGSVTLVVGP